MPDPSPDFYYDTHAYRQNNITAQKPSVRQKSFGSFSIRLPWGSTQNITLTRLMEQLKPKSMRYWKTVEKQKEIQIANHTYVPAPFEGVEFHNKQNHEIFKHAPLPFRSQFWVVMLQLGLISTILLTPLTMLAHMILLSNTRDSWQVVTIDMVLHVYP
ncbi:hypothetical protein KDX38_28590, partial [Pseudomonas sp. CDFA 602]|nr:hypothetical protein [Pseudomonas californiensis]MCD6003112.1 hypothetical protein [Pseudomonas californiensis]